MSQGWHCTVAAATGRELTASWWTFQRQSDSKGRFWGFEVFFLCLGNFQEKFQGQIIDLHLWFLSRCFMHRPSLLPKGVKMPRELNRGDAQRWNPKKGHLYLPPGCFAGFVQGEVSLVQVTAHTQHSKSPGMAWEVDRADMNLAKGGIKFSSCCSPSRNPSPHLIWDSVIEHSQHSPLK